VTVSLSPNGLTEEVSLTAEYPRTTYVPERELERARDTRKLFPGQAELRNRSDQTRAQGLYLAKNVAARKTLSEAFTTAFGR